jgi:predicted NUDIX family phosphoesterase
MTELVICVPTAWIAANLAEGINDVPIGRVLKESDWRWMRRSAAETHPEYAHIVTYGVLGCGDQVFVYRRGSSGGEGRLHGLLSIGVGGHVTPEDFPDGRVTEDGIRSSALRELAEEIEGDPPIASVFIGLLHDTSNEVSRVHLGAVYLYEFADTSAVAREDCLADALWMASGEVIGRECGFEAWSRGIIAALYG